MSEGIQKVGFSNVDSAVFGLMLTLSVGIGVYSGMRGGGSSSTQEYLLGGRRMAPLPVALSLIGGVISSISLIGNSSEVYYYGTQATTSLIGVTLGVLFIIKFSLPVFYKLRIVSLNEYLELRYKSVVVRRLGTIAFLLQAATFMGMCQYGPALALATVSPLSTTTSMVIMASVCTFYTTLGGVKGVVYTDVLQTLLMLGGVLVVVVLCCIDLGGLDEVWASADMGHRLQFFEYNPSPYIRHTLWSTISLGFFIILNYVAFHQATHQRFVSVKSLRISRGLCWSFLVGFWVLWLMFYLTGLEAYVTYRQCDPLSAGQIKKPDQILPYLVTDKLGHLPGLPGVFVAAVYGGVLSTLSSCGNSAACLVWEDFLKHRPYFSALTDRGATNVIKLLACVSGVVAMAVGLLLGNLGNIFQVMNTITGTFAGPIVGIFLSGLFLPWVNAKGAVVGFLGSFICSVWLVVGKFLRGGSSPPPLPLSTLGCSDLLGFNITTLPTTSTSHLNTLDYGSLSDLLGLDLTTLPTTSASHLNNTLAYVTLSENMLNTTLPKQQDDPGTSTLYDLSYCYTGFFGALVTMVLATLVSLFGGPTHPKTIGVGLVNPTCERFYRWLWELASRYFGCGMDLKVEQGEDGDNEEHRRYDAELSTMEVKWTCGRERRMKEQVQMNGEIERLGKDNCKLEDKWQHGEKDTEEGLTTLNEVWTDGGLREEEGREKHR